MYYVPLTLMSVHSDQDHKQAFAWIGKCHSDTQETTVDLLMWTGKYVILTSPEIYRENRRDVVGTIVESYISLNNTGTNESPAIWEALVNVCGL